MKRKLLTVVLFLMVLAISCNWNNDRLKVDLSSVRIPEVKIERYDKDLFSIPLSDLRNGLAAIQPRYMFFLGTDLDDEAKLAEMNAYLTNPRNIDFQKAVGQKFSDLSGIEKDLTGGFRHMRYYFPGIPVPVVYSYISGGDYDNPVQLADSVMIIALDTYLGADFKPYLSDGVPLYKVLCMTPDQIVPDCMRTVVGKLMPVSVSLNTFLDQIVDAGKRIYLLDTFIPDVPGDLKMDYSQGQYSWIVKNESHVWSAIIENRMLYSSDGQTMRTFLADGPFTPAFGKDSPPRLGEWIGWKIVKSYMNSHPDVTLDQLISEQDSQKILAESGYKPEKD